MWRYSESLILGNGDVTSLHHKDVVGLSVCRIRRLWLLLQILGRREALVVVTSR
jgi:hypothetical protein